MHFIKCIWNFCIKFKEKNNFFKPLYAFAPTKWGTFIPHGMTKWQNSLFHIALFTTTRISFKVVNLESAFHPKFPVVALFPHIWVL